MELAEKNRLIKYSLNRILLKKKNQLSIKKRAFAFGKARVIKSLLVKKLESEVERIKNNNFFSVDSLESVKEFIELEKIFGKDLLSVTLNGQVINLKGLFDQTITLYAQIEILFDDLQLKAEDLKYRGYTPEADKTTQMVSGLRYYNSLFFKQEKINYALYMAKTHKILNQDRKLLEKHRGYKKIFANLSILILTAGSAFIIHKAVTGKFLFFNKTDTIDKIDKIEKKIEDSAAIDSIRLTQPARATRSVCK